MTRFSATQYDHFKLRFKRIIQQKVDALGEGESFSNDEKIQMVLGGKAELSQDRLLPKDGSCQRYVREFLSFFDYPGEDEMSVRNIALSGKKSKLEKKLKAQLDELLEQYVVGLLSAKDLLSKIKEIENKK